MRFSSTAYTTLSFVRGLNFPRVLSLFTSTDGSRATVCVAQMVKNLLANAGDPGLILGSGRSSGGENGNPLQYSGLENLMDRGGWSATVHRVARSWKQLSD